MKQILRIFLTALCSISFNWSYSQTIFDTNGNPIPYVNITISSNLNQFWYSDINGEIPKQPILEMTELDTMKIQHISYEPKWLTKKDLMLNDSIIISHNIYELQEVQISSKLRKYHKIDACFRNTVIQNHEPIYFSDGKVTYFAKNKKLNYNLKRDEFRAFTHLKINDYLDHYSVSIPVNNAFTPILEDKYLPYQFIKKQNLILLPKDSLNMVILTKDSLVIGEIKKRRNFIEYSVNNIFEIKTRKALNTEVDITDFNIYLLFKNETNLDFRSIDSFNQLIYTKMVYNYTLTHDKDLKKREIETIEEIFVEDITFIDREEEEYTNKRGMPLKSHYNSDFWDNCDCAFYYKNFNFLDSMKEL